MRGLFLFTMASPSFATGAVDSPPRLINTRPVSKGLHYKEVRDGRDSSEATRANLEKPGAWLGFMNPQRFTKMMEIWNEIELKLRGACNALIARPGGASRWGVSGKRLSVARSARWGASSTPAEIYSKPPSERLLRVIFHRKTAKMGI
jgi:hypothetical protein